MENNKTYGEERRRRRGRGGGGPGITNGATGGEGIGPIHYPNVYIVFAWFGASGHVAAEGGGARRVEDVSGGRGREKGVCGGREGRVEEWEGADGAGRGVSSRLLGRRCVCLCF